MGSLVALISYHWPRTALFRVVDTEVKRIDNNDQYRITAIRQKDDKRMVFRNEDAWHRLKFNSADIQGDAAIAERENLVVEMTYYGWRSNFLSWFWNVSDLEVLREKTRNLPQQE
ncbi:DUF1523 family protein [Nitrosococcus wardiae]|uniref:DUF1523 family protein n=1 Tax=Nitrosococcus wardiae TaxID=1814290 RepID=A0A4P7C2W6_9GAMM|nr:DUF1523 family protein [Nitrosococcus wardiae]